MSIFRSTLRRLTSVRYLRVMWRIPASTSCTSKLSSCSDLSPSGPPDDPGSNAFIACLTESCPTDAYIKEFLLYFGLNLRSFPNQWTYASHNSVSVLDLVFANFNLKISIDLYSIWSPMRKHKPVIVEATLSCIPTECRQSENYVSFSRHVNCDLISEKDINKAFVNLQHGFVEQSYETILNSLLDATIPCRPDNRNPRLPEVPSYAN
ncbi:hypothetical protein GJ496_004899 [Pomphorhynchus laevis]|nr:hypothetical protein GJ496_004899 [Pomphorhynchus laevis]